MNEYLQKVKCNNVFLYGKYNPSEKSKIIEQVDILFNIYGNDRLLVKFALSNKLYDSFFHKKSLLTSPNTSMSEMCEKYSFDFDFNVKNVMDKLYNWYFSLDYKFNEYADSKILGFIEEQNLFYRKLKEVVD